jgi:hypothetical protein
MPANNLPAGFDPSILPVEKRLPQPDADATTLLRLVTESLDPQGKNKEPTVWILNRAHPQAGSKILRMYHRDDGGVEVYSSDGQMFVRTIIPARIVLFLDEAMSEETFIQFITIAEEDEDEEEEPGEPGDPGSDPDPDPDPANPDPDPEPAPGAAS